MIKTTYRIGFNLQMENSDLILPLSADVEIDPAGYFYRVRNLMVNGTQVRSVLPDMDIKKLNEYWVHLESEKETNLSACIGRAIEEQENT